MDVARNLAAIEAIEAIEVIEVVSGALFDLEVVSFVREKMVG
jgi:hypothetical protein